MKWLSFAGSVSLPDICPVCCASLSAGAGSADFSSCAAFLFINSCRKLSALTVCTFCLSSPVFSSGAVSAFPLTSVCLADLFCAFFSRRRSAASFSSRFRSSLAASSSCRASSSSSSRWRSHSSSSSCLRIARSSRPCCARMRDSSILRTRK